MSNKDNNSFAYKFGQVMAAVIGGCLMAALIGLTVKFLMWVLIGG